MRVRYAKDYTNKSNKINSPKKIEDTRTDVINDTNETNIFDLFYIKQIKRKVTSKSTKLPKRDYDRLDI